MNYFIFSDTDTTLYQASGSSNAGLDEILEIRKTMSISGGNIKVSRILMKFDLGEISGSIVNGTITNPKFYLNLYDAGSENLSTSQSLWAYPVSQSWVEGQGTFSDSPATTNGASWQYRDDSTQRTYWLADGATNVSSSGGSWQTAVYASQSFKYEDTDMRMNVTPIVNKWLDGTYPNNGFIIKRSGSYGNSDTNTDEGSQDRLGNFKFFSRQTHTIYPPKLEVEWYDTKWSTGSLSGLSSTELEDMSVYMKGLRTEYKENSKVKFRLVGRAKYPTKSYSNTASEYLTAKYLPSGSVENIGGDGSYYSVLDAQTEDVIVPFGTGSLISCDSTGNYFNLWMNGLQAERYYKFQFRVVSGSNTVDETIQHFDDDFIFKVVR
tara:strand:- start:2503 stop:3639 length:1137 start_codon:yes stop_codon:yes gene_type:complete